MGQDRAQDQIALAVHRVVLAADRWNAVDLEALGDCLSTLESSASDLGDALAILKASPANAAGVSRSHILELKNAALRLERLADSSASFLRCAPGLNVAESGFYEAGGSLRHTPLAGEMRGMQV